MMAFSMPCYVKDKNCRTCFSRELAAAEENANSRSKQDWYRAYGEYRQGNE